MAYNDVTETKEVVIGCELDCDGCGVQAAVAKMGVRTDPPAEWAILQPPGDRNPYHTQHFCPDCSLALEGVVKEMTRQRTPVQQGSALVQPEVRS